MDYNAKYKEKFSSNLPLFNYLKPKDDQFSLEGALSSTKGTCFLQDFHLLENNVNLNGSSSSISKSLFSINQNSLDSFGNSSFGYFLPNFEVYESKPFGNLGTNNGALLPLMENFNYQSEGLFGHSQIITTTTTTPFHMINPSVHSYPFNFCEFIPPNYRPSAEYSCTNPKNDVSITFNGVSTTTMVRKEEQGRKKKTHNVVKGQWTAEEDRALNQLVERYGVRKWSQIAQMLNGRIGKQCRERWHNHLRPDIKTHIDEYTCPDMASRKVNRLFAKEQRREKEIITKQ